jgi:hypothetical protein
MGNFLEHNPERAYLLPPTVREVLGEGPVEPAGCSGHNCTGLSDCG